MRCQKAGFRRQNPAWDGNTPRHTGWRCREPTGFLASSFLLRHRFPRHHTHPRRNSLSLRQRDFQAGKHPRRHRGFLLDREEYLRKVCSLGLVCGKSCLWKHHRIQACKDFRPCRKIRLHRIPIGNKGFQRNRRIQEGWKRDRFP
jgi:hypothetical protein